MWEHTFIEWQEGGCMDGAMKATKTQLQTKEVSCMSQKESITWAKSQGPTSNELEMFSIELYPEGMAHPGYERPSLLLNTINWNEVILKWRSSLINEAPPRNSDNLKFTRCYSWFCRYVMLNHWKIRLNPRLLKINEKFEYYWFSYGQEMTWMELSIKSLPLVLQTG